MSELLKVKIDGLALDVSTNSPVVVLKPEDGEDEEENRVLPIWIGHFEAMAIAMALSNMEQRRPLTHDLIKLIVTGFDGNVEKIEITELKEQTFYAVIYIKSKDGILQIDARPSDSIAIALRCDAPIFASEELFHIKKGEGAPDNYPDPEALKERLKKINPEDFGRYSL
ncbi:MAG: bifunctional nuclease family protein [candidate division Zixibacteria bacterium]|nr:bifunctional nuclease family protein [candidate division Zixibacteria bacterium]